MAEIGLQRPRIVALVGQGKTTGVPEHVRVSLETELGGLAGALDHLGIACACLERAAGNSESFNLDRSRRAVTEARPLPTRLPVSSNAFARMPSIGAAIRCWARSQKRLFPCPSR